VLPGEGSVAASTTKSALAVGSASSGDPSSPTNPNVA
jgi:hypothetical protein